MELSIQICYISVRKYYQVKFYRISCSYNMQLIGYRDILNSYIKVMVYINVEKANAIHSMMSEC